MDKDVTDPQWNLTQPQNDWNNAICSNTDGPRDYCTKCGNSDRKTKNHTSQMWNLKNWCKWTHVQNRKEAETKKTNLQAREGKEGGNKLRVWDTHTHILLFIKWINSKVLLYSTRNYIQHHKCVCIQLLSRTRLFVTPRTIAPSGSSVLGILQARILKWVAMPFSRGSSRPRDWTCVSCIAGRFCTFWATREALISLYSHVLG